MQTVIAVIFVTHLAELARTNLRTQLVKHKIYLKAGECTMFDILEANAKSPAASASARANVSTLSSTASAKDDQLSSIDEDSLSEALTSSVN